jgi:meso-butanediol dehydrogenase/(S,S)-butanediol dehydrogenase/diacetyl reductase
MRFKGKIALISGGGTGIGAAVATRFAADGGDVVLIGRRRLPLEAVARRTGAAIVAGDAAEAADVRRAVTVAVERFGGLDVVVANAAVYFSGAALAMDDSAWRESARLNIDSTFVCIRESLPELLNRKGNIVVISSIAGLAAGPEAIAYTTAKHALLGLTRSVARDYGPRGVRINAVLPAFTRTEMADELMEALRRERNFKSIDEAYQLATQNLPLRRPATPEEMANVVCFLASDEAAMMTGSSVVVDGGATSVDVPTLALF